MQQQEQQQQLQQQQQQNPNERIVLNWTDEETIKFIELYQRDASHLDLGRRRKNRNAYQRMSTEMEKYGYFRSADQLIRKMKRLRFDYKKAKEKPDGHKEFKYYDHMELMFRQQSPLISSAPLIPLQGGIFSHYTVVPRVTPPLRDGAGEEECGEGASSVGDSGEHRLAKMEDIREAYEGQLQNTLQTSALRVPAFQNPLMDTSSEVVCSIPLHSSLPSSPGSSEMLEIVPEGHDEVDDDDDDEDVEDDLTRERFDLEAAQLKRNSGSNLIQAPPAKRKRPSKDGGSMVEFLVNKVMKMQESTERQYIRLLERQMAVEDQRRKDNQEFQLKLVSLLTSSLPRQASQSNDDVTEVQRDQVLNRYIGQLFNAVGCSEAYNYNQCLTGHFWCCSKMLSKLSPFFSCNSPLPPFLPPPPPPFPSEKQFGKV